MHGFRVWGLALGLVVAQGAFATGTPLRITLPLERKDANLVRDGAVYLLNGVAAKDGALQKDSWEIETSELPADFLKALGKKSTAGEIYSAFKSEPFRTFYRDETRKRFHSKLELPTTLAAFEKLYSFRDSTQGFSETVVTMSDVKKAKRVIYRAPTRVADMSIAQTIILDATGKESIRETEVIIKREGSDDFDFFVYSPAGDLVTESEFASATGKKILAPVPITCMACHYDPTTRTLVRENNLHF